MIKNRLIKEEIEKKRKLGYSWSDLSLEYNTPIHTLFYSFNEKYRERKKKSQRAYELNKYRTKVLTPKEKKKRNEKSKKYFHDKYNNDPEFRAKHLERVKKDKKFNEKYKGELNKDEKERSLKQDVS